MVVADNSVGHESLLPHSKEDVDSSVDWDGCCQLISEVGDEFPPDCVLLVVHGEDNLVHMLEPLDGCIS